MKEKNLEENEESEDDPQEIITVSTSAAFGSIDVLENYFAQQLDQEEGRKQIEILRNKLLKKSKMQKQQISICLFLKNANN